MPQPLLVSLIILVIGYITGDKHFPQDTPFEVQYQDKPQVHYSGENIPAASSPAYQPPAASPPQPLKPPVMAEPVMAELQIRSTHGLSMFGARRSSQRAEMTFGSAQTPHNSALAKGSRAARPPLQPRDMSLLACVSRLAGKGPRDLFLQGSLSPASKIQAVDRRIKKPGFN